MVRQHRGCPAPLFHVARPIALGWLVLAFVLIDGCEKKADPAVLTAASEEGLRQALGIPNDAARVLVFGQNAHMDLNWLATFEGYYDRYVEGILGSALDILDENPRYYYAMAEMAFLQKHMERHPEDRDRLRTHARSGRFRIVGGGLTSPDVVLPTGESLLRDFLYGRRFTLDEFGVGSSTAWLPDDFGLGMNLPTVLAEAGYKYAALSRADGVDSFIMPNMDYVPRPGSTAERLLNGRAIDFYWRGADGTRILTHWMPSMYCQGDNIDYDEPLQLPGGHIGPFRPDAEFTNARIKLYLSKLDTVSPTDYMFVPVGCDFAFPKPGLVDYMDHWNETEYPKTGVWAVAATFEDFARLVEFQKTRVPEMEVDVAPYFMGFYGSRVELKKLHREASYAMAAAEAASALESLFAPASYPRAALREAWEKLAWSNHHDWLPGTSPDAVYKGEQLPVLQDVLARARAHLDDALAALTRRVSTLEVEGTPVVAWNLLSFDRSGMVTLELDTAVFSDGPPEVVDVESKMSLPAWPESGGSASGTVGAKGSWHVYVPDVPAFGYKTLAVRPGGGSGVASETGRRIEISWFKGQESTSNPEGADRLVIDNGVLSLTFEKSVAWGLTRLSQVSQTGRNWFRGVGFDVVENLDEGGMWRLGHEMEGCTFHRTVRLAEGSAAIRVSSLGVGPEAVRVETSGTLAGVEVDREVRLVGGEDRVLFHVKTAAASEATVTGLFETGQTQPIIRMATPYAWAARPVHRHYDPTYWPILEWLDASAPDGSGLLFVSLASQGWHVGEDGDIELMLTRNARVEKCQLLGAIGTDPDPHEVAFWLIPHDGELDVEGAYREAFELHQPLRAVPTDRHEGSLPPRHGFLRLGGGPVITALKRAETNDALVLRLFSPAGSPTDGTLVSVLGDFGFRRAYVANAMEEGERDPSNLAASHVLHMDRHLLTLVIR